MTVRVRVDERVVERQKLEHAEVTAFGVAIEPSRSSAASASEEVRYSRTRCIKGPLLGAVVRKFSDAVFAFYKRRLLDPPRGAAAPAPVWEPTKLAVV